ncbi:protein canopy homolog 3 [Ascaphus truei]|uniref:protein canopy homolog 3 n=1 Tax=Ascaphus truei TaxID=8439 RepID=UPI003F5A549D
MWLLLILIPLGASTAGDGDWVHLPSKCEVCKYVAVELKSSFDETSRTGEVIDTRYNFLEDDTKKKKVKYIKSDIRLIEVTEGICQRLLEYNLHKERSGSNRFAKVRPLLAYLYNTLLNVFLALCTFSETCRDSVHVTAVGTRVRSVRRAGIRAGSLLVGTLCSDWVSLVSAGCLSEKWGSKKGDTAPSRGKIKQKNEGEKNRKKNKKGKLDKKEARSLASQTPEEEENPVRQTPGENGNPKRQNPQNRPNEEL